ncbi:Origin recognition complex subunit 3, partial [Rhizopus stolonifer]
QEEDQEIMFGGFQRLLNGNETQETLVYRKESFKEAWNEMDTIMNDILMDMNQKTIRDIRQFVDKAHEVKERMISLPFHEIPTALVFAGINTPDHSAQFAHIASDLKQTERNFVSLIQAKDCSTVKNMIKVMIERFMENTNEEMDPVIEDEEDEQPSYQVGSSIAKESKALPFDMQLLEGWYNHKSNKLRPNLVVILQDFEAFEPSVLQDFFVICSEYQASLPIVCIMGIATSTEILHQSLTKYTIGLLRIERFKLENSDVWFNRVFEKIFLDGTDTLKFGPLPYKFLLDHFYLYDFSIAKVSASLKYALMHHFYGNPLSVFLPLMRLDQEQMEIRQKEQWTDKMLNAHHVAHIRMLPSFKAYIESLATVEPKRALLLLKDDEELLIHEVPRLLTEMKQYQHQFTLGIQLVQLLQSQFPSFTSLKKSKRMILLEALESKEGFVERSQLIKVLVSLLRKIDLAHVTRISKELRILFRNEAEVISKLDEWETRAMELIDKSEKEKNGVEGMILSNAEDMHGRHTATAQKAQAESMEYIKKLGTESSKLAFEIADWCNDYLGCWLQPFAKRPLHEIVYYTSSRLLEKSFASQPRATVQTALTQPQHYLNCNCCQDNSTDQLNVTEPDSCILYKLYLECGRMINLYDWFIAFSSIIKKEQRPQKKELGEDEAQ